MLRLLAIWAAFVAISILLVILREERLTSQGKVPVGRLRRFWLRGERRRAPRYRVDWSIRYHRLGPSSAGTGPARIRDVSQTGVGLVMEERLETGSELKLEMTLPDRTAPFAITGRVAWAKEILAKRQSDRAKRIFFVGIQFMGIPPETAEQILKVLHGKEVVPWQ